MVQMDLIGIDQYQYLAVTIKLPSLTTRLIYCTKGILFDDCWNLDKVACRCRVPVCIGKGKSIEALLENEITLCSLKAMEKGIVSQMKGQEALRKMMHEE